MSTGTRHLIRAVRVGPTSDRGETPDGLTIDFGCGPEGTDFDVGGTICDPDASVVSCTLDGTWSANPLNNFPSTKQWTGHFSGITAGGPYLLEATGDQGSTACCNVTVSSVGTAGIKRCQVAIGVPATCQSTCPIPMFGVSLCGTGCEASELRIAYPMHLGAPSLIIVGRMTKADDRVVLCTLNGKRPQMTTHHGDEWLATFARLEPGRYKVEVPRNNEHPETLDVLLTAAKRIHAK